MGVLQYAHTIHPNYTPRPPLAVKVVEPPTVAPTSTPSVVGDQPLHHYLQI